MIAAARRRNNNAAQWRARKAENRAEWAREQTRRARERAVRAQERAANAHEQYKSAQEHADRLKEQVQAVQSSRAWKLLGALSSVKNASRGFVARLRKRAAKLPEVKEPLKEPLEKPSRMVTSNGKNPDEEGQKPKGQKPKKPEKMEASRTVFFIVGSG